MDPATAAAFLSGLASVSTIAKNIHDWILAGKVPEKKVILEDADKAASAVAEDSKAIESVLRISEKVFKSIERRIKRARKKLEEVLGDPYMDDEDRREIMKECDKTICEALKDVKHYNNGALPKKLKDFWEENSYNGKF